MDYTASARLLGLRYVSDRLPGVRRQRIGRGFRYVLPNGVVVRDPDQLRRFRSLVIPPAWREVWICPTDIGHLQATGRDQRGRKQYRYHTRFRQVRNQTKFDRLRSFGAVLPQIRRRVRRDMKGRGLTRTKVLATVVRLLEATAIRVGNEEYAEQNDSYGLTTLRNKHVQVGGEELRFRFKGKSGQAHDIRVRDRKLARIVAQCQSLPGQALFEYLDSDNQPVSVSSEDVNDYLREISGDEFTAKDFRTWVGTAEAVTALEEIGPADSETQRKKNIVAAVKMVAQRLGNRAATCKAYYIHPAVLSAYESGTFFPAIEKCAIQPGSLRRAEQLALALVNGGPALARAS